MRRRPARWQSPPPRPPRRPRETGVGRGQLIVLLIIVGLILLIGLHAPSIRVESLLALFGFR